MHGIKRYQKLDLINRPLTLAGAVSAMYEGAACIAKPAGKGDLLSLISS